MSKKIKYAISKFGPCEISEYLYETIGEPYEYCAEVPLKEYRFDEKFIKLVESTCFTTSLEIYEVEIEDDEYVEIVSEYDSANHCFSEALKIHKSN